MLEEIARALQACLVIALSGAFVLLTAPLWPFMGAAFIQWKLIERQQEPFPLF